MLSPLSTATVAAAVAAATIAAATIAATVAATVAAAAITTTTLTSGTRHAPHPIALSKTPPRPHHSLQTCD